MGMRIVFNTEGNNEALGPYVESDLDQDTVTYRDAAGNYKHAPADCVAVREITRDEMQEVFSSFKTDITGAGYWLGGDSVTAMNSLIGIAAQMIEYAQTHGARLSVDVALTELRRQIRDEGRYRGDRTHSRVFEETTT